MSFMYLPCPALYKQQWLSAGMLGTKAQIKQRGLLLLRAGILTSFSNAAHLNSYKKIGS